MADITLQIDATPAIDLTIEIGQGPAGPPGSGGGSGSGSISYEHIQAQPADTWIINHNLGYRPGIALLSTGGRYMLAELIHTGLNQAVAYFDQPTAGTAACS